MRLFVSSIASALSFPKMLKERLRPVKPKDDRIAYQEDESLYHNLKNYTTETLRADCQWWSKCLSFVVYLQLLLLIIAVLI